MNSGSFQVVCRRCGVTAAGAVGAPCPTGCGYHLLDGRVLETTLDPQLGRCIDGDFVPIAVVADGRSSRVYRARELSRGCDVVLKVQHPTPSTGPAWPDRYLRTALILTELDHPSIARVHHVGHLDDGRPFVILDWIKGPNLELHRVMGRFGPDLTVQVINAALRALTALHERDVVHGDIRPRNMVLAGGALPELGSRTEPRLIDFGTVPSSRRPAPTEEASAHPTIFCLAPEQHRGQPVTPRTDIYAAGVLLYWMLAGRYPFEPSAERPTVFDVTQAHCERAPPPLPGDVPANLAQVAISALQKAPEARYPDVAAMANAVAIAAASITSVPTLPGDPPVDPVAAPLIDRVPRRQTQPYSDWSKVRSTGPNLAGLLNLADTIEPVQPQKTEALKVVAFCGRCGAARIASRAFVTRNRSCVGCGGRLTSSHVDSAIRAGAMAPAARPGSVGIGLGLVGQGRIRLTPASLRIGVRLKDGRRLICTDPSPRLWLARSEKGTPPTIEIRNAHQAPIPLNQLRCAPAAKISSHRGGGTRVMLEPGESVDVELERWPEEAGAGVVYEIAFVQERERETLYVMELCAFPRSFRISVSIAETGWITADGPADLEAPNASEGAGSLSLTVAPGAAIAWMIEGDMPLPEPAAFGGVLRLGEGEGRLEIPLTVATHGMTCRTWHGRIPADLGPATTLPFHVDLRFEGALETVERHGEMMIAAGWSAQAGKTEPNDALPEEPQQEPVDGSLADTAAHVFVPPEAATPDKTDEQVIPTGAIADAVSADEPAGVDPFEVDPFEVDSTALPAATTPAGDQAPRQPVAVYSSMELATSPDGHPDGLIDVPAFVHDGVDQGSSDDAEPEAPIPAVTIGFEHLHAFCIRNTGDVPARIIAGHVTGEYDHAVVPWVDVHRSDDDAHKFDSFQKLGPLSLRPTQMTTLGLCLRPDADTVSASARPTLLRLVLKVEGWQEPCRALVVIREIHEVRPLTLPLAVELGASSARVAIHDGDRMVPLFRGFEADAASGSAVSAALAIEGDPRLVPALVALRRYEIGPDNTRRLEARVGRDAVARLLASLRGRSRSEAASGPILDELLPAFARGPNGEIDGLAQGRPLMLAQRGEKRPTHILVYGSDVLEIMLRDVLDRVTHRYRISPREIALIYPVAFCEIHLERLFRVLRQIQPEATVRLGMCDASAYVSALIWGLAPSGRGRPAPIRVLVIDAGRSATHLSGLTVRWADDGTIHIEVDGHRSLAQGTDGLGQRLDEMVLAPAIEETLELASQRTGSVDWTHFAGGSPPAVGSAPRVETCDFGSVDYDSVDYGSVDFSTSDIDAGSMAGHNSVNVADSGAWPGALRGTVAPFPFQARQEDDPEGAALPSPLAARSAFPFNPRASDTTTPGLLAPPPPVAPVGRPPPWTESPAPESTPPPAGAPRFVGVSPPKNVNPKMRQWMLGDRLARRALHDCLRARLADVESARLGQLDGLRSWIPHLLLTDANGLPARPTAAQRRAIEETEIRRDPYQAVVDQNFADIASSARIFARSVWRSAVGTDPDVVLIAGRGAQTPGLRRRTRTVFGATTEVQYADPNPTDLAFAALRGALSHFSGGQRPGHPNQPRIVVHPPADCVDVSVLEQTGTDRLRTIFERGLPIRHALAYLPIEAPTRRFFLTRLGVEEPLLCGHATFDLPTLARRALGARPDARQDDPSLTSPGRSLIPAVDRPVKFPEVALKVWIQSDYERGQRFLMAQPVGMADCSPDDLATALEATARETPSLLDAGNQVDANDALEQWFAASATPPKLVGIEEHPLDEARAVAKYPTGLGPM